MRELWSWLLGQWRTIWFVAVSAALMYVSAVVLLRVGERRTLSEMSPFDFAVAIAVGAIIGRTATTASPSYVQGMTALVTLLVVHNLLSRLRLRWPWVRSLVERPPRVVVRDGRIDDEAMRRAHLTHDDLYTRLRERGVVRLEDVHLVVLETRGAISIVPSDGAPPDAVMFRGLETSSSTGGDADAAPGGSGGQRDGGVRSGRDAANW